MSIWWIHVVLCHRTFSFTYLNMHITCLLEHIVHTLICMYYWATCPALMLICTTRGHIYCSHRLQQLTVSDSWVVQEERMGLSETGSRWFVCHCNWYMSMQALKSAERKTKQTLKEAQTTATIIKARKTYWSVSICLSVYWYLPVCLSVCWCLSVCLPICPCLQIAHTVFCL